MENPEKLLDLLSQDARLTPAQLAAMTGASEEEVTDASGLLKRILPFWAIRP